MSESDWLLFRKCFDLSLDGSSMWRCFYEYLRLPERVSCGHSEVTVKNIPKKQNDGWWISSSDLSSSSPSGTSSDSLLHGSSSRNIPYKKVGIFFWLLIIFLYYPGNVFFSFFCREISLKFSPPLPRTGVRSSLWLLTPRWWNTYSFCERYWSTDLCTPCPRKSAKYGTACSKYRLREYLLYPYTYRSLLWGIYRFKYARITDAYERYWSDNLFRRRKSKARKSYPNNSLQKRTCINRKISQKWEIFLTVTSLSIH